MRMRNTILVCMVLAILAFSIGCDDTGINPVDTNMETAKDSVSYAIGVQIAQSLKQLNSDVDIDLMAAAIKEALADNAQLTPEQCQQIISADQIKSQQRVAVKNLEEGQAFLEENGKKPGIITTPSGLQYEVIKEGVGEVPNKDNIVTMHYTGKFIDGTVFQSSLDSGQPIVNSVSGFVKGWTEGLQLMKPGGKMTFYIPADLAYGLQGRPGIPPNSALIFEVEMISFE